MAVEGAIAERTRGILPVTWDALSRDPRFGDGILRTTIDTVKERTFGVSVDPTVESAYPLVVIDYAAKLVAIELCDPGIEIWMDQPVSESATGTNENHTFVDRAETLRKLREALLTETRLEAPNVAPLINFTRISNQPRPKINTLDDEFLTPSPQEFPRPYAPTSRS